jgi:hypothetical protein
MSTSDHDELLSAFLDGELSPDEMRALERRIASSPRDRELLEELTETSQAIRLLRRPYAPPELRTAILDQIDQQHPALAIRSLSRSWRTKQAAGWSALTAAGLLLMVGTWALLKTDRPGLEAKLAKSESLPLARAQTPAEQPLPRPPEIAAAAPMRSQPVQVVGLSKDEIRRKIAELDHHPMPGNAIQIPASIHTEAGETPIVVVFTVVDVMHAMNQMQVLVKKQQVRTLDNRVLEQDQANSPDSQLTAVTLELAMDGPEMAAILNSISALDAVMYVEDSPQQTLLFAETDAQSKPDSAGKLSSAAPKAGDSVPRRKDADAAAEPEMLAASEQPTHFEFQQLADPAAPLPGNGNGPGQAAAERRAGASGVGNDSLEPSATIAADQRAPKETLSSARGMSQPRPAAAPGNAVAAPRLAAGSPSEGPSTSDWDRARKFRAIILLKQQHREGKTHLAPEAD